MELFSTAFQYRLRDRRQRTAATAETIRRREKPPRREFTPAKAEYRQHTDAISGDAGIRPRATPAFLPPAQPHYFPCLSYNMPSLIAQ